MPQSISPAADSRAAAGRDCGRAVYHEDKRRCREVIPQSTMAGSRCSCIRRACPVSATAKEKNLLMYCLIWPLLGYQTQEACVYIRGKCLYVCFKSLFCPDCERIMYELEIGLHLLAKPQESTSVFSWADGGTAVAFMQCLHGGFHPSGGGVAGPEMCTKTYHSDRYTHGCFCWRGKY